MAQISLNIQEVKAELVVSTWEILGINLDISNQDT